MKFKLPPVVFLIAGLLACYSAPASDQVPGQRQARPVALVGGTVYPISGEPIEDGVVVFAEGRIRAVGANGQVRIPEDAEEIDCSGKRIYPGLLDGANQVGLIEIGAVPVTRDTNEVGAMNPNAFVHVSVNPDSEIIPTTRANGVLLVNVVPDGGVISGQSAVMMMDGWTYEEMTLRPGTGLRLNWPSMLPRQGWNIQTPPEQQLRARDEALQRIEDFFDDAARYRLALQAAGEPVAAGTRLSRSRQDQAPGAPEYDARLEGMVPVLEGEVPLLVYADESSQIQAAVAFAHRRGLKLIIVGGQDAGKNARLLAEHDVPVILDGTHRLPSNRDEPYDEPFALPATLHEAGVRFAIAGNRAPAFARNLPYHAASAVAFGLPEDVALASLTLYPAQILGVADRVGSLEEGKDATLFIADGDILELPTQVTDAWINGRPVDLTSRHTRLNEKYKRRYGQD